MYYRENRKSDSKEIFCTTYIYSLRLVIINNFRTSRTNSNLLVTDSCLRFHSASKWITLNTCNRVSLARDSELALDWEREKEGEKQRKIKRLEGERKRIE